ncbi:MAG: hypothetical protein K9W43_12680 [Candidatus Thorarchaeota archaeon]|nr:hypothetical protein [Candidatus Thorarchaeota archaeon]
MRVFETSLQFWQEIFPSSSIIPENSEITNVILQRSRRIHIVCNCGLGNSHTYVLRIDTIKIPVVYTIDEKNNKGELIIIENLESLKNRLGIKRSLDEYLRSVDEISIEEPTEYGKPGKELVRIEKSDFEVLIKYSPYYPLSHIFTSPSLFMMLAPADKAITIVETIRKKYNTEMNRVLNRFPLRLGIVFADSHTPLRSILDAGRRMSDIQYPTSSWVVVDDVMTNSVCDDVYWQCVLKSTDHKEVIEWCVPCYIKETIEDVWYPFVFVKNDAVFEKHKDKLELLFKAENPWNNGHMDWLIHIKHLKQGMTVYFTPSTIDFIWLDTAGSRFSIAYGSDGRRKDSTSHPYVFSRWDQLFHIWEVLRNHLSNSQIYQIVDLVEERRERWLNDDDVSTEKIDTFKEFSTHVFSNAEWRKKSGKYPWELENMLKAVWVDRWAEYLVDGLVTDSVHLFMQILKKKSAVKG